MITLNNMDRLLFQMHIMWYESKMIPEVLDSIQHAALYSEIPINFQFCLNSQTYLESPIQGNADDMFTEFIDHPLMKNVELVYKSNDDSFYNIGDWRREVCDSNAKYTIWGESDCLLPEDFFYILSTLEIHDPHMLTFASRRMGDYTWDEVEHRGLRQYRRTNNTSYTAPHPYNSIDVISQRELNEFNEQFDIEITQVNKCKIDGSLLCLSSNLPTPFIPDDMHFVREDTCAERFFELHNIPQYVIGTRIKGHNYHHPLKRTNTIATREDEIFKHFSNESTMAMYRFLQNTTNRKRSGDI